MIYGDKLAQNFLAYYKWNLVLDVRPRSRQYDGTSLGLMCSVEG